jgi:hypothetical protein
MRIMMRSKSLVREKLTRGRLLAFALLISVTAATAVTAQEGGQGLEIAPPVIELKADPGQTVEARIRVRNITNQTLIAKGRVDDFVASGEEGQPKILLDNTEVSSFSLKSLIERVPDMTLVPKEVKTAVIPIRVPQNASPGGHYGVIRFTAVPPELEGSGVSLSASIGTLVLLNVSGDVKEGANVAEFKTGKLSKVKDQSGQEVSKFEPSWFFEKPPVGMLLRVANTGNVHVKPAGEIEVRGLFGKVASIKVNERGGNVLPDSTRRFEQEFSKRFMFGVYRAKTNLNYGDGKQLNAASVNFVVIPYKIVVPILLVLILVAIAARQGLKRYNRMIIEKARRG